MLGVALLPPEIAALISTVTTLLILAIFVRVILSYFPGMTYSTLGRLLFVTTEWIMAPVRRFVPPIGGIDFSPAVAIFVLYGIRLLLVSGDLVGAVLTIVLGILLLLIILLFIRVAFGFFRVDPWHPIVQMVVHSSEPLIRPFRSWFPRRVGRFDWAPIAALLVLFVAYYLLSYLNSHRTF